MPTSAGPNISGEENLVFGYDLSDTNNSYRGEPTINLATNANFSNGTTGWASNQNTTLSIETINNTRFLKVKSNQTNSTPGFKSGNIAVNGNTTYTLTIRAFKNDSRSIWLYATGNGTGGSDIVWSNAAYNGPNPITNTLTTISRTFTTPADMTYLQIGALWSAPLTTSEVYIEYMQLEQKSHVTPFVNGTRSSTQGLLDLTATSDINLSTVSFDSNAQMAFDGTNDQIEILNHTPIIPGTSDFSIEMVVKSDTTARMWYVSGYNAGAGPGYYAIGSQDGQFIYDMKNSNGQRQESTGFVAMNTGQIYHIIVTRNTTGLKIFINGQLQASDSAVGPFNMNETTIRFGSEYGIRQYLDGNIYMYKHYNRVLSTTEVINNYNNIKSKYGI